MYPKRHEIYNAVITKMVTEALRKKEEQFALEHKDSADEELLLYMRKQAVLLGHSPHKKEIVGWAYITERFGSWQTALNCAHLPNPRTENKLSTFQLVIDEHEIQKQNYRKKKAEKKIKAAQHRKEQAQKKKQKETKTKQL